MGGRAEEASGRVPITIKIPHCYCCYRFLPSKNNKDMMMMMMMMVMMVMMVELRVERLTFSRQIQTVCIHIVVFQSTVATFHSSISNQIRYVSIGSGPIRISEYPLGNW